MPDANVPNTITGRDAFLRVLKDEGVTKMFGNPGTTELPIMHALSSAPEMGYVLALQEAVVIGIQSQGIRPMQVLLVIVQAVRIVVERRLIDLRSKAEEGLELVADLLGKDGSRRQPKGTQYPQHRPDAGRAIFLLSRVRHRMIPPVGPIAYLRLYRRPWSLRLSTSWFPDWVTW